MLTHRQLKRLHKYVKGLFKFKHEPFDCWYTIKECMEQGGGDCDDYRMAFYEHLLLLGVPVHQMKFLDIVIGKGRHKGEWHAVLSVLVGQQHYIFCNIYGVMDEDRYFSKTRYDLARIFSAGDEELPLLAQEHLNRYREARWMENTIKREALP